MQPVETPFTAVNFIGGEDIGDLPAHVDHEGAVRSVWELTPEDRCAIEAGGRIELSVMAHPPPPVGLTVVGPYDEFHERFKEWSSELGSWTIHVEEN